jgi:alkaline phosphatase
MARKFNRLTLAAICLGLLISSLSVPSVKADTVNKSGKEVRNVIILIPDGMSVTATTLARW